MKTEDRTSRASSTVSNIILKWRELVIYGSARKCYANPAQHTIFWSMVEESHKSTSAVARKNSHKCLQMPEYRIGKWHQYKVCLWKELMADLHIIFLNFEDYEIEIFGIKMHKDIMRYRKEEILRRVSSPFHLFGYLHEKN